jgi:hypothetical protein
VGALQATNLQIQEYCPAPGKLVTAWGLRGKSWSYVRNPKSWMLLETLNFDPGDDLVSLQLSLPEMIWPCLWCSNILV